jgi:anaerobic selenocysteine-containing dehydrogenase
VRTRTAVTVTPDAVAERRGVPAGVIRRLARELAVADRGVVHAPIGATTQEFGSMTSWLVDVLNTGTGTSIARAVPCSRSRPPVVRTPTRPGPGGGHDRWTSRVRGAWGHVGSGLAWA